MCVHWKLAALQAAGLSTKTAFVLLSTFVQGCVTHLLRANLENGPWLDALDEVFFEYFNQMVGTQLRQDQKMQACMRLSDGGLALFSARRAPPEPSWAVGLRA